MTTILFILIYLLTIAGIYWVVCARFKYDPAIDFAFGMQTGDYKLASIKLLEVVILNFLIATGLRYSLLALLEFTIFVGSLID